MGCRLAWQHTCIRHACLTLAVSLADGCACTFYSLLGIYACRSDRNTITAFRPRRPPEPSTTPPHHQAMTGLFLLGITCSGYTVLPLLQRATPPHARTAVAEMRSWSHFSSFSDFSGQSLESQIKGNWDQIDTLVAAANAREDFGGVVGGSYLMMSGLLLTAVVTVLFFLVKKAQPQTEITDGLFDIFEEPEFVAPLPGGGEAFKWRAGMPLPSLAQLKNQCTIIGEELGCPAQL